MEINSLGIFSYQKLTDVPKTQKKDEECSLASNPNTNYEVAEKPFISDFHTYLVAKGLDFHEICIKKPLVKDDYQKLLQENYGWQISPDAIDDTTALILSGHIKDIKDVNDASTLAKVMIYEANQTNVSHLRRNLLQRAIKLLPNGKFNNELYSENLREEILKSSLALTKDPLDNETRPIWYALEDSEKNNNPYYKEWSYSGFVNYYTYIKMKAVSTEDEIRMMNDSTVDKAKKQQFIYEKLLDVASKEENIKEKKFLMSMATLNKEMIKAVSNITSEKSLTVNEDTNKHNDIVNNIPVQANIDITQKQDELAELFKIKDASFDMWPRVEDNRLSTFVKNFSDKILSVDGKLLSKKDEILKIIEKAKNISQQEIEDDSKKIAHPPCAIQLYFGEIIRKEFLENLYQSVKNDTNNDNIDLKSHIDNVQKKLEKKHSSEFLEEQAKNNLDSKSDDEININKIELTKEDIALLKSYIDHHEVKDEYDFKKLSNMIISEYVGGNYNMKHLPPHIQTTCLQTQKRYNSEERWFNPTKKEPVYRWLHINDVPDFIKNFPEVGQEYSYPNLQSCSKYEEYAENEFRDDSPDMLVKLVIHPLAETSQAYDIGSRKYGSNEVIYPSNTKFKVIGKEFVETKKRDEKYGTASPTFYRYVIHLQEAAPDSEAIK